MHIFPSAANACALNPGDNILDNALGGSGKKKTYIITFFVAKHNHHYKTNKKHLMNQ